MKKHRHPPRPPSRTAMDSYHNEAAAPLDEAPPPPEVAMGQAMPDVDAVARHSTLASGLAFTGSARIAGSVTVAGEVQGDLLLQGTPDGHVTVTETGTVVGDITAPNISVLGQTVGVLDASGGRVTLHETASVSGRIRYTHLQVNGADLNAQLERVRPDGEGAGRG
jgi:cytoskeletal protein CcmA (bactofilin family)